MTMASDESGPKPAWREVIDCATPEGFPEAVAAIRECAERCDRQGLGADAVNAALMAEALRRFADAHGPVLLAMTLSQAAAALISAGGEEPPSMH
jgi:stage V sporulation protein SpoVS